MFDEKIPFGPNFSLYRQNLKKSENLIISYLDTFLQALKCLGSSGDPSLVRFLISYRKSIYSKNNKNVFQVQLFFLLLAFNRPKSDRSPNRFKQNSLMKLSSSMLLKNKIGAQDYPFAHLL